MAKRFTDTEKWKKKSLKGIPPAYKLLWIYLCDDCDHAGIWIVDIEIASIRIGEEINEQDALRYLASHIHPFDGGEKWFIPSFIEFQYGTLSEKNRVHQSVIERLKKYSLHEIKPLTSPLQGVKEKDKEKEQEKDKDKDKDKEQDFGKSENLLNGSQLIPTICRNWYNTFPTYTKDQDQDFKAAMQIVSFMQRQHAITDIADSNSRELVLATMEQIGDCITKDTFWLNKPLKSIANNIQEFYNKIKNPQKNGKEQISREQFRSDLQTEFNKRYPVQQSA